jgi:hypothetical protein
MGLRLWPWVLGLQRGSVAVGLRHGSFLVVCLVCGRGSWVCRCGSWVCRCGSVAVGIGSLAWVCGSGLRRESVAVVSDVGLSSLLMCSGFLVVNMFGFIR